jgi:hypothetical protein
MRVTIILMVLCKLSLGIFLAVAAIAQTDGWERVLALQPGQRVFVSYAKERTEGELARTSPDTIVIKTKTVEVTAARADVKKVAIPARNRGRHALIGAAIGAAASLLPALVLRIRLNNETGDGEQAAALAVAGGGGIRRVIRNQQPGTNNKKKPP